MDIEKASIRVSTVLSLIVAIIIPGIAYWVNAQDDKIAGVAEEVKELEERYESEVDELEGKYETMVSEQSQYKLEVVEKVNSIHTRQEVFTTQQRSIITILERLENKVDGLE